MKDRESDSVFEIEKSCDHSCGHACFSFVEEEENINPDERENDCTEMRMDEGYTIENEIAEGKTRLVNYLQFFDTSQGDGILFLETNDYEDYYDNDENEDLCWEEIRENLSPELMGKTCENRRCLHF